MSQVDSDLAPLFLSHSVAKLEQITGYLEVCLHRLTPEQVWHREHESSNAIGNLIVHLIGNVRQWIGHTIAGRPDVRNRPAEFDPGIQHAPGELAAKLRETVDDAVVALWTLTSERLAERVQSQDGERSVLEVVYQVVGHFQQHAGQVIYATKEMTGEDLAFYRPPK